MLPERVGENSPVRILLSALLWYSITIESGIGWFGCPY
jgi:hypothetical protein